LSDVLSDLRMLLDRLLGEQVELNVVHGRDVWPVKADLSQFETVIINLAVNARDAMPRGGKVTIRTANVSRADVAKRYPYKGMPEADYVLIEVEDEGTGMTREIMEKIFEPFFSTKEVGKGTGLGLSTVYGIVKQTGGFIYPESDPGKGSVFRLFLPRHVPVTKPALESDKVQAVKADAKAARDLTGNARILLVEDEDAVRAFALRALKTRGFEVHEAATGVEALEKMAEIGNKVDLVVSDVVMPEMDGPTLLRELRKTMPGLKFIFMSGYAEDAFAKNLPNQENEQFEFLPKPFTLKQLITKVKEVLEE
jgi:two-component system cell cycle sensor histidine kinase/response regulator CckA